LKRRADKKKKLEEEQKREKKFPSQPERDVMQFLMEHAPLERWQALHPDFEADIHAAIAPRQVVAARRSEGGTGFEQVLGQLALARKRLHG